jgi:hypothetical protein
MTEDELAGLPAAAGAAHEQSAADTAAEETH